MSVAKPYHKSRHPWKNQDLRSDAKRAVQGPRPGLMTCGWPGCVIKVQTGFCFEHTSARKVEPPAPPVELCIEIVEFGGDSPERVEKKLGPYATERQRDKADDGLNRQLNHERFFTRFVP